MENITMEKVDAVKSRTGASYSKIKEALEYANGDVLDAIIYIEENVNFSETVNEIGNKQEAYNETKKAAVETVEEFKEWLKELINKGNITRLKLKKDDEVLVDVPVNAGIAAAVIAIVLPPVLAFGVIAAVATKITVEITKSDGTVEVINKYVERAASEVKEKTSNFAAQMKEKFNSVKDKNDNFQSNKKEYKGDGNTYSYTVNFDEKDEEK